MRSLRAKINHITALQASFFLVKLSSPQLVQNAQPGQFYMVRCSAAQSTDPFLRRPYHLHSVQPDQGTCTLLVKQQGRGSSWLVQQAAGVELDLLGPLGRGWIIGPDTTNLLLIAEGERIAAVTQLAQVAVARELAVTLLYLSSPQSLDYPPVLLPAEVEYHLVDGDLGQVLEPYLLWADALCCSTSLERMQPLYAAYERLRGRNFAQIALWEPLPCGYGACLSCSLKTRSGLSLLCREGPVFMLRNMILR